MKLCKLLFAVVGATVLLGALVSSASARIIETSSQTITANFASVRFRGLFGTTDCAVTLAGSLHSRNNAKVVNSLIGFINRADLGPCATGRATILRETLPWHVQYAAFTGTLPNITGINTNVIGSAFRITSPENITCLAVSTAAQPARGNYTVAGGVITGVTIGGAITTSCGNLGTFTSSVGSVRGGAGVAISVRLI